MKAFFLPYYGEFGWRILHHVRYVADFRADEKIISIEKGEECLYPSATSFFYDWNHPFPDEHRTGDSAFVNSDKAQAINSRIKSLIPTDWTTVEYQYDCHWHTSDSIKPLLSVSQELKKINIAICPRKRNFVPEANFNKWDKLIEILQKVGLTIGLVGKADTSFKDLKSDEQAWNYSQGATAGTIDILNHCDLYLGTDTGVSHLAALLDIPMLVWYISRHGGWNLTGLMERANKKYCRVLPEGPGNIDELVGATISYMALNSDR